MYRLCRDKHKSQMCGFTEVYTSWPEAEHFRFSYHRQFSYQRASEKDQGRSFYPFLSLSYMSVDCSFIIPVHFWAEWSLDLILNKKVN